MAKGKKQAAPTKKKPVLAKRFKCPFCANEDVVEAKMDLKSGTGSLSCRICGASYQMPIHHLHEPIDVFSEWLDDCEAAERGEVAAARPGENRRQQNMKNVVHDTEKDYDDDDEEEEERVENKSAAARGKEISNATLGLDDSDDDSDA